MLYQSQSADDLPVSQFFAQQGHSSSAVALDESYCHDFAIGEIAAMEAVYLTISVHYVMFDYCEYTVLMMLLQPCLVYDLKCMLDQHNAYARAFRCVRDWNCCHPSLNISLKLIRHRSNDHRI
ncbi:hypothetical protein RIF29_38213 [Crotalaria pallida]|uniref:Uncharacterized protein n=1 Tax=Crotalaria pallida TaxID=3830 RepID=A0AAN9DYW4_CROPI